MLNSTDLGKVGETKFLYEFSKRGIQVSIPYGNSARYDMIADFNGKLNRIQIKTSTQISKGLTNESVLVKCTSYTTRINGSEASYENEVEYIGCYIPEYDIALLIPIEEIGNSKTFSIRLKEDTIKTGGPKPHYIKDYLIDTIIK